MTEISTVFVEGTPRLALDRAGSGPLVLFLHGIGGNRSNWTAQIEALCDSFHAVAWDARGYGESDDYEGKLDFGDFARDALRVLDRFGAETAHFVGLSMGGRIAQDFCARYPDRVATLVLCDTMSDFRDSMTPEKRAEFIRLRQAPLKAGKEPRDIADALVDSLAGPGADEPARRRLWDSIAALHKESYLKTIEASLSFDRSAEIDRISVPTLLIYGEHDRLTPPSIGEALHRRIAGSELAVIEDAGHLSNIERPEAFNAALLAFLSKHRDRAVARRTESAGRTAE
ncbi:MAG: alpha/beta fold hydrolase [Defluviicoccus sp.]|nr:alpha/beta fold hydrolase [Defluviicoccus sp.]MDE0384938.1 alpha/beta fold hydrolase [Defluviicoccus sp.]